MMHEIDYLQEAIYAEERHAERAKAELFDQEDFKTVMGTIAGRRFLNKLLHHTGLFESTFTPGAPDVAAFKEGRRDVGRWIDSQMREHPDLYLTYLFEVNNGPNSNT